MQNEPIPPQRDAGCRLASATVRVDRYAAQEIAPVDRRNIKRRSGRRERLPDDLVDQGHPGQLRIINDGATKLIIDPATERVLGVGIVGYGAGELIAEATLAIEMDCVASDLKLTIHAHPTLSETVMEAAEVYFGQATHFASAKRK